MATERPAQAAGMIFGGARDRDLQSDPFADTPPAAVPVTDEMIAACQAHITADTHGGAPVQTGVGVPQVDRPQVSEAEANEAKIERLLGFGVKAEVTLTAGVHQVTGEIDAATGAGIDPLLLDLAEKVESGHDLDPVTGRCTKCNEPTWRVVEGAPCVPKPLP